ncbi:MAG TPA: hypothetical protein DEW22_07050 [Clostridiales bacterium]|nr:hypothetical protein [Clostridiales bacterium]
MYVQSAESSLFTEDASMIDTTRSQKYIRLEAFGMGPYAMKKLKICKKCGQIAGAWSFFCPACKSIISGGTLFDTYKRMHVHCPHCKTVLASDTQYCPHCGRKVLLNTNEQSLK